MDLKGQLSNPSRAVGTLAGQGSRASEDVGDSLQTVGSESHHGPSSSASEEKGQLSNPVQRRRTDTEIDGLVTRHQAGSTIEALAFEFGVHRTTVMAHLQRRGVPARTLRKLTRGQVRSAWSS